MYSCIMLILKFAIKYCEFLKLKIAVDRKIKTMHRQTPCFFFYQSQQKAKSMGFTVTTYFL